MKKLLSIILAILMIATSVPLAFAADTAVPDTVYFDNTSSAWSTVNAYFFDGSYQSVYNNWPGTQMAEVGDNIYSIEVPEGALYVVFNDNTNRQTADLTIPTDGANCYDYGSNGWTTFSFAAEGDVASVTDKDGNVVGSYATFAEAITAAQENEDSTLTMLTGVTLTQQQNISYGKFTLDLNGKVITTSVMNGIKVDGSNTMLIIDDSGEGGKIENTSSETFASAIYLNEATLTINDGTIVQTGEAALPYTVNVSGTLNIYDGEILSSTGYAILNYETVNIYGGTLISESNYTIYNHKTLNISGGRLEGLLGGIVYNYDSYDALKVSVSGGEFPDGLSVYDWDEILTLGNILADGYAYYDEDGNIITVSAEDIEIEGYVHVKVRCLHENYTDGVCDVCGVCRLHESWTDGVCDTCGTICYHKNYTDGECDVCGTICKHENYTNGECDACGTICYHENFADGVCDDCGTIAEEIKAGNTYTIDKVKYMKFVPSVTGTYIISSTSTVDPYLSVYDSDLNQLYNADDSSYRDENSFDFYLEYKFTAGETYYFRFGDWFYSYNYTVILECKTHSGGEATCKVKAVCEACGQEYGDVDKDNHDIIIDEAVEPTCTETGLTECSHCSRCDNATVEQEVIPATNHKDTLVQVEAQAKTCTTVGWDAYEYCKDCTYTTKVEIPASGHTKETVKGYAATCTETGLSDGVKCSACGDTLTAQEVIPSNGHTEETVKGYDATCTETGLSDGVKCSACGDTLTEQTVISAKGHVDVNADGVCDNGGEAIEKQEPDTPDEPSDEPTDDTTNDCDHLCHTQANLFSSFGK